MIMPLVFVLIATLEPIAAPVAQAAERVHVSPNSPKNLGFEWDGKDTKGKVHNTPVFRAILTYTNPALPAAKLTVIYDSVAEIDALGTTKIPMSVALRGVPSGDWDCTVALEDVAGNLGPPSLVTDKTRFKVSADPPTAPQNVGVVD